MCYDDKRSFLSKIYKKGAGVLAKGRIMIQLDNRLEEAIWTLWIRPDFAKGREALGKLEMLAQEGNADAYYFLARCYAGEGFIREEFGFPDNDDSLWEDNLNKSIEGGSALGMFAGRRFGGFEPRCGSFIQPPYHNDKEIWDEVCALADAGEVFTQYLVANAYYYGDVAEFLSFDARNLTNAQIEDAFRRWAITAAKMYEDQFSRGVFIGWGNYMDIFTCGDYSIPKDEKRAKSVLQIAADAGYPIPGWKKTLFGWKRK